MKVTVENKKGLNKDVKVFIDKKTMDFYMNEKYEEIKSSVNLKGFRPGKVPREILKRQFGKAVFSEVLNKVLKDIQERDERDSNRKESPLVPAVDAKKIDTSNMTIAEVYESVSKLIESELKK